MKAMSMKEMEILTGGKRKKCGGCNKTFRTWVTYTYHTLNSFRKQNEKCLLYVIQHEW